MNIQQITECPDCASPNIVHNYDREQVICKECGLIYEPLTPAEEEQFESAHELAAAKPAAKKAPVKAAKKVPAKKKK